MNNDLVYQNNVDNLNEKLNKPITDSKKYFEKNIIELKKLNQIKNDINKKIIKEKISTNRINRNSIILLSQHLPNNFNSFDSNFPEIKFRGSNLIIENIL